MKDDVNRRNDGVTAIRSYGDTARPRRLSELAQDVFGGDFEEARKDGHIGFYARVLTQATMPHSRPSEAVVTRRNGDLQLRMAALGPGLPYGTIPRLLLTWMTTEAVRTKQRELVLGDHLAGFMRALDLVPTGGRWGTIPRLRAQMTRLLSTAVGVTYADREGAGGAGWVVADQYQLWWDPKSPHQAALWESTVTLGEPFYRMLVDRPIPVDMAALRALRRSPLALDYYTWVTYRMSYLKKPTTVPWAGLHEQFGAEYGRVRKFHEKSLVALQKVARVYPEARMEMVDGGLRLSPSPTSIQRIQ